MTNLKKLRLLSGISQEKLGRQIKRSRALVSMMERGIVSPGSDLKKAISEAFGEPEETIFPKR